MCMDARRQSKLIKNGETAVSIILIPYPLVLPVELDQQNRFMGTKQLVWM